MEETLYRAYVKILEEELIPAMGCTEPIAVAYAGALARQTLGELPESVDVQVSANIIKNVKSVVVPHTGGLRGIAAAAAAGIVAGDAGKELEVLSAVTQEQIAPMADYLHNTPIAISPSPSGYIFDIQIRAEAGGHTAFVQIAGSHTNVIRIERDGQALLARDYTEGGQVDRTDRSLLNVEQIVAFADCVEIGDVRAVLDRQIDFNTAIAQEGLRGNWGANIGSVLLKAYGNDVANRAKATAAAGSDARMSGCEKPVVINSGSGNQGMTASLPVIVYAEELNASREQLYRALAVSNLVTIHLKTGIGRLSAYCGATSAGCGAGAGVTYLQGGGANEIDHRQRRGHQLRHDLRRGQAQLRGQDRLRGGGGAAGHADAAPGRAVLRRGRHCGQRGGEHHPQCGPPGPVRHGGDRPGDHRHDAGRTGPGVLTRTAAGCLCAVRWDKTK